MVDLVSVKSENNYAGSREAPSVPSVQSRGLCDAISGDKYVTREALGERKPPSTRYCDRWKSYTQAVTTQGYRTE